MTTDYHQRIGNRLAQQSARVRSDAAAIGAEADAEIARLQAQLKASRAGMDALLERMSLDKHLASDDFSRVFNKHKITIGEGARAFEVWLVARRDFASGLVERANKADSLQAQVAELQREVSERRVVSSTQLDVIGQLADALDEARTGLKWYQDRHPESTDGSDDEAMARIDAALLRVGR